MERHQPCRDIHTSRLRGEQPPSFHTPSTWADPTTCSAWQDGTEVTLCSSGLGGHMAPALWFTVQEACQGAHTLPPVSQPPRQSISPWNLGFNSQKQDWFHTQNTIHVIHRFYKLEKQNHTINSNRCKKCGFCFVLLNIYLAVLGLSCGVWDPSLQHVDSLVVAHGPHSCSVQA